jgi:pimeloyl-ACP methyl ester carboxylesterase
MLDARFQVLASGSKLRLARLGAGPPLVLLHGYPDNLQIWSRLAPLLASRFEVIAFDWPGMGYSDEWPGGATPVHMADRLLRLVDEWKLRRVHLMGLDMGGQPALVFAARNRKRIGRLVVMNSLVYGDERTSWEIRVLRKFGWNRFLLRRMPRAIFHRAERTFLPPGMRLSPELHADLWNAFRQTAVRRFITKMCSGFQAALPSLPDFYGQIDCPTLILWAERDRHFPSRHAERLHRDIAGSKLFVVPQAEHWMTWQMAEAVAEQVEPFLLQQPGD